MFKHLLVPLDGSSLAESALPAAAYLAQALGASLTLIHIIETDAPETIHGEQHLADPDEARRYLDEVATRVFPPGLPVERHVHTRAASDVARSIVEHVDELAPDLIVMCTHGRGGLRGLLSGSIAQQVIALGKTPVLLIRPGVKEEEGQPQGIAPAQADGEGIAPAFVLRKLLVPLDGNPDHEQGLSVAAGLARACSAEVYMLMVVPTAETLTWQSGATARLLPGTTAALLDIAQDDAMSYLRKRLTQLQASGVATAAEIQRGDPLKAIMDAARRVEASLIVLGTHGRSQMDAFWSGSVTPKVAGQASLPLLLVPVSESAPER
jgi:nucleotide-binding universal stress UspA family protein